MMTLIKMTMMTIIMMIMMMTLMMMVMMMMMMMNGCLASAVWNGSYLINEVLLKDYNPNQPPVSLPQQPVNVSVAVGLLTIVQLDFKGQLMESVGWISLTWKDPALSWDRGRYELSHVQLPADKVWRPYLVIENQVDQDSLPKDPKMRLHVSSYGQVTWMTGGQLRTSCYLDMAKYPMDTQTCSLLLRTWFPNHPLQHNFAQEPFDTSRMQNREGWRVVRTDLQKMEAEGEAQVLVFTLTVKRNMLHNLIFLVIPVLMLSQLNVLVFSVPSDSGEKVTLSIVIVLSMVNLLSLTTDSLSKDSSQICYFTLFGTLQMALGIICCFASSVISYIFEEDYVKKEDDSVPLETVSASARRRLTFSLGQLQLGTEDLLMLRALSGLPDSAFNSSNDSEEQTQGDNPGTNSRHEECSGDERGDGKAPDIVNKSDDNNITASIPTNNTDDKNATATTSTKDTDNRNTTANTPTSNNDDRNTTATTSTKDTDNRNTTANTPTNNNDDRNATATTSTNITDNSNTITSTHQRVTDNMNPSKSTGTSAHGNSNSNARLTPTTVHGKRTNRSTLDNVHGNKNTNSITRNRVPHNRSTTRVHDKCSGSSSLRIIQDDKISSSAIISRSVRKNMSTDGAIFTSRGYYQIPTCKAKPGFMPVDKHMPECTASMILEDRRRNKRTSTHARQKNSNRFTPRNIHDETNSNGLPTPRDRHRKEEAPRIVPDDQDTKGIVTPITDDRNACDTTTPITDHRELTGDRNNNTGRQAERRRPALLPTILEDKEESRAISPTSTPLSLLKVPNRARQRHVAFSSASSSSSSSSPSSSSSFSPSIFSSWTLSWRLLKRFKNLQRTERRVLAQSLDRICFVLTIAVNTVMILIFSALIEFG